MIRKPSRWCFEHRVELAAFIGGIGFLFYLVSPFQLTRFAARWASLPEESTVRAVYLLLGLLNLATGALRIWAGGTLGGARMMSVRVRDDALIIAGPYAHVRNPIYLADILTLAGMGLVVPELGTLVVWTLLALIYPRIIAYEEQTLSAKYGARYADYAARVPRLGWRIDPYRSEGTNAAFSFREGLLNNFLYLPLIPGFLVAAATGVLWHGVAVGAIGPVAWIVQHFWRNFKPGGLARKTDDGDAQDC